MRLRPSPPRIGEQVVRYRFLWLIVALLVFFLFVPVLRELGELTHPRLLTILEAAFFLGVLVAVVTSVGRTRSQQRFTLALGLSVAALWVLPSSVAIDPLRVARHVLAIAFFGYAIVGILRLIFDSRTVTFDLLCASLCAYLLLGVVCALTYSALSILNPGDFRSAVADDVTPAAMQLDTGGSGNALYFSFVTLTTLGYGDIVPASALTRRLAVVEAIVGQLYLAVLVARLVGLHIVEESQDRDTA